MWLSPEEASRAGGDCRATAAVSKDERDLRVRLEK
jgi:hypothetical protein